MNPEYKENEFHQLDQQQQAEIAKDVLVRLLGVKCQQDAHTDSRRQGVKRERTVWEISPRGNTVARLQQYLRIYGDQRSRNPVGYKLVPWIGGFEERSGTAVAQAVAQKKQERKKPVVAGADLGLEAIPSTKDPRADGQRIYDLLSTYIPKPGDEPFPRPDASVEIDEEGNVSIVSTGQPDIIQISDEVTAIVMGVRFCPIVGDDNHGKIQFLTPQE